MKTKIIIKIQSSLNHTSKFEVSRVLRYSCSQKYLKKWVFQSSGRGGGSYFVVIFFIEDAGLKNSRHFGRCGMDLDLVT